MKVLVYLRKEPLKSFYFNLASSLQPDNIYSISDFRGVGDFWIGDYIYQNSTTPHFTFDEKEIEDIYYRCRFLRSISKAKGYDLINKVSSGVYNLMSNLDPDLILAPIIDNYTLDILNRIAKKRHIRWISFVGHFFNGYSRISERGEYNYFPREVTDEEVRSVKEKVLHTSYVPQFHVNLKTSIATKKKLYYRELFKRYLYFPLMKTIERDALNYHYSSFDRAKNIFNIKRYINNDVDIFFTSVSEVKRATNNVYFPLHLTPEATVDYWCEDYRYGAFYEDSIIDIIQKSSKDIVFLIKEHPTMYLWRDMKFYERLLQFDNVKLIHPLETSNLLLPKVQVVYTENGSVGVEALLRNKLVVYSSENYYSKFHPNAIYSRYISNETIGTELSNYDNNVFIKDILQGNFRALLYNNNNINNSSFIDICNAVKVHYEYEGKE